MCWFAKTYTSTRRWTGAIFHVPRRLNNRLPFVAKNGDGFFACAILSCLRLTRISIASFSPFVDRVGAAVYRFANRLPVFRTVVLILYIAMKMHEIAFDAHTTQFDVARIRDGSARIDS